jgi:hypothetical protein
MVSHAVYLIFIKLWHCWCPVLDCNYLIVCPCRKIFTEILRNNFYSCCLLLTFLCFWIHSHYIWNLQNIFCTKIDTEVCKDDMFSYTYCVLFIKYRRLYLLISLQLAGIVPYVRLNLLTLTEVALCQSLVMILLTFSVFPTVQSVEEWSKCLQSSNRPFSCLNCSFVTKCYFKHFLNFWCSVLSVKWNLMYMCGSPITKWWTVLIAYSNKHLLRSSAEGYACKSL